MEHSPPIKFHLLVGLVPDQTAQTVIPSTDDGLRYRACFENPQFCDAWHIDGFSEDYFETVERESEPSGEKNVRPCNHRGSRSPPVGRILHRGAISLAGRDRTDLAASEGRRPWAFCSSGVRKPVDNFRPAFTLMRKPWRGCRRNTRKRIARIATQIIFGCLGKPRWSTRSRRKIGLKIRASSR